MAENPKNTIIAAKRLIGRNFHDPSIQSDMKHWPFTVINYNGKPKIEIEYKGENKTFYPEEISSMVLTKMKETAENFQGKAVTNAVITVPAYFNYFQRQATKDAGEIAGLKVLRIIIEPTAAAIAYGLNKQSDENRNVLIFDLGGGTFDVSILTITSGIFEVKAVAGDTHLGGEDFDARLLDHLTKNFQLKHEKDLRINDRAMRRLKNSCETAKRHLSSSTVASIEIDSIIDGIDFSSTITRARFEELNGDLFQSTLQHVEKALNDAKMDKDEIHDIVLVGGSTRIPKIQKLVQEFFNGKELNRSINVDEAVAYGAAVQAGILNNDKSKILQDILLLDITSLSLGFETRGGLMKVMIQRNTRTPVKHSAIITTSQDNQTVIKLRIFQGERPLAKENQLVEELSIHGIQPAPRKTAKIEVSFQINTDGILHIHTITRGLKRKNISTFTVNKKHLSKEEIERMIEEAQKYKEEDEKKKASIDAKLDLENYIYLLKEAVKDTRLKYIVPENEIYMLFYRAAESIHLINTQGEIAKELYIRSKNKLELLWNPVLQKLFCRPIIDEIE
ncbi:Heat shock protein cognate 4 [Araneus ventricosus]|uniref:Heat shock protein cognate 4 n=1 Tax=Araneus ventricosus TaxID=182803 RepID=A0A4Y2KPD5_ARAVE|nr:Heat shock protein cognate 4 [Araneus ventricosus]